MVYIIQVYKLCYTIYLYIYLSICIHGSSICIHAVVFNTNAHSSSSSSSSLVPRPPEPHGRGALASSKEFFQSARQALQTGGTLSVVTDQESVYITASLLLSHDFKGRGGFRVVESHSSTRERERDGGRGAGGHSETAGDGEGGRGARVAGGGRGGGGGVSFFDALWTKRGFHRRWVLRCEAI